MLLVVMGFARLGSVIQFVPYPVTVGFTSGIALLIAASQVRDFLGLRIETLPAEFVEKIASYAEHIATWNPWALSIARRTVPAGIEVFEVQGALFFGAATKFRESIQQVETPPRVLVVRLRNVIAIDASGLHELELLCDESARRGTAVVLSGVHAQPLITLERSGLLEGLGAENVCPDIDAALARAQRLLEDGAANAARSS